MRDVLTTLAEIVGAALVVAGLGLVSVPAALVVAGLILILGGIVQGGER